MLGRRLLMSAGGWGSYSPPAPTPSVFALAASPVGIGSTATDPRAFTYNGVVYLAAVNSTTGYVMAWSYDIATATASAPVAVGAAGSADVHSGPSVIVRSSDHRIVVAWSAHDAANFQIAVSTNPEDASAFGAASNKTISGASNDYTYMSMVQLNGEANDPIYLFWRDYNGTYGRIAYSTSTDGGSTWAAVTLLVTADGDAGQVVYWRVGTDWDTRIDILTTDSDRHDDSPSSVYHLWYEGGDWHQSDGTVISTAKPFTADQGTLVHDGGDGSCQVAGVAWDGAAPAGVFMIYKSVGPTNEVWSARYRSGAWQTDFVADTNGLMGGNRYHGGPAMTRTDPDTVFSAIKVGAKFEIVEITSPDDGATWIDAQRTTASGSDAMDVETPAHAVAGLRVFWSRGTFTSDSSFLVGTEGLA